MNLWNNSNSYETDNVTLQGLWGKEEYLSFQFSFLGCLNKTEDAQLNLNFR